MSVFGRLTVTPNRMEILFRFLAQNGGGLPEADLKALMAPRALRNKEEEEDAEGAVSSIADELLPEAYTLGLAAKTDGVVRLNPALQGLDGDGVRGYMETQLLKTDGTEQAKAKEQFPFALAWLLIQDPAEPIDWTPNSPLKDRVTADCGPACQAFDLSNNRRFQNFVYWAQYFGYAWRFQQPDNKVNGVLPDPTDALERHIRRLMQPGEELTAREFVSRLGQQNPVLEGGAVRERVEAMLLVKGKRRKADTLSRSTSLALLRLRRRKVIAFGRHSDAPALSLASWPDEEPISFVRRLG